MHDEQRILENAQAVLQQNDCKDYTRPAPKLYPHQWLWDSCFIAIGLRHLDNQRAQTELLSLTRGQWHNGMLPNIIFRADQQYRLDRNIWRSWLSPYAPDDVATSGITQPPMLAEAVVQVGSKLSLPERRSWYGRIYPALLKHHVWLYDERDPHKEGLVLQIHPWETGLDNTPTWTNEIHQHLSPLWIRLVEISQLDKLLVRLRRDTLSVPINQRYDMHDSLILYDMQRRLLRKGYDINRILDHSPLIIEDLTFNAILIRANQHLRHIASSLRETLPEGLEAKMHHTERALEELWDAQSKQYYSRDFVTHRLLRIPTIASLMPLYAGSISQEKADLLVKQLENEQLFGTAFPVPSVPPSSDYFDAERYWQGPSWINTNWLIIDGLRRYGFNDHVDALRESSLEMIQNNGNYEYFNPLTGSGLGSDNFSWTAALAIDLIKSVTS